MLSTLIHSLPKQVRMKYNFWSLLLCTAFFASAPFAAADLQVWTDKAAGIYPSTFTVQIEANLKAAKVFWTRLADASPADGLMYDEPIAIERTGSLYFFAFTPEPTVDSTPMQKVLYFVESRSGYEHLRIHQVIPQSKIVILKNYSQFPVDLKDWQLESIKATVILEAKTLAPDEETKITLEMKPIFSEIMLRAPDGMAKQLAALPILKVNEAWRCESRRSSSCGVFEK